MPSKGQYVFTYLADFDKVGLYGFADSAGNTKTAGIYNYILSPVDGLCIVVAGMTGNGNVLGVRRGFSKPDGTEVVPPIYHNVKNFSEGMAAVAINENMLLPNSKWGFIDNKGVEKILPQYDDVGSFAYGLAPVSTSEGKWSYIDKSGAVKIPGPFRTAETFSEGLAAVSVPYDIGYGVMSHRYGYIDINGKMFIKAAYNYARPFKDGVAVVNSNSGYQALIDKTGKRLTTKEYVEIRDYPSEGLFPVKLSEKNNDAGLKEVTWGVIDKTGKELEGVTFDREPNFSEGLTLFTKDGKWGYKDKTGKEVIPARYAEAYKFSDGLAPVKINAREKVGYINKVGEIVIQPKYFTRSDFSEGVASVGIGEGYNDKNTVYGVIDKTGKTIIPFEKRTISEFKNGRAVAEKNHISYYINKKGETTLAADVETLYNTRWAFQQLRKNNIESAYEALKKLEDKNYSPAQYFLGYIMLQAKPPMLDVTKGSSLILKAASAGHPEAMYTAGIIYGTGIGTTPDYIKALEWFKKAEAAGVITASKELGIMHEKGLGVPMDYTKAAMYYQKAAEAGEPVAMYNLAMLYLTGIGVTKDENKAFEWIKKSAKKGFKPAKELEVKMAKK